MTGPTPDPSGNITPGLYHAEGDPPGTVRQWDGVQWVGGPVPAPPGSQPVAPIGNEQRADVGVRIGAILIDGLLMVIIGTVVALPGILDAIDEADRNDGTFEYTAGAEQFVGPLLGLALMIITVATLGGSPGKLALGLRVTTIDGTTPPGFGPATLRALPWIPTMIPVLGFIVWIGLAVAGVVMISNDPERRSPFDRVASTRVIRKR